MREASSVVLAARLVAEGAEVAGYDPVVSHAQAAALLPRGIQLAESALEAARGADAVVIVTEWPEFAAPFADGSLLAVMRTPLVIDGRNQLDPGGRARRRLRLRGRRPRRVAAHRPQTKLESARGCRRARGRGGHAPAAPHAGTTEARSAPARPPAPGLRARAAGRGRRDARDLRLRLPARSRSRPASASARYGLALEYVVEPRPMGTAGGIRHAARGRVSGTFLALNGDILADAPLADLVAVAPRARRAGHDRAHAGRGSRAATGSCAPRATAACSASSRSPSPSRSTPNLINAGAYVLEAGVLDLIEDGQRRLDRARDVPRARRRGPLRARAGAATGRTSARRRATSPPTTTCSPAASARSCPD